MKNKSLLKVKVSFYTEFVCEGASDPKDHAQKANDAFWSNLSSIMDQLDDPPVVTCQIINDATELPAGWDAGCCPWKARKTGKDKPISEYFNE